jgi:hypothetical protein
MGKRSKKGYTPPSPNNRAARKRRERAQQFRTGQDAPPRGSPIANTGFKPASSKGE